MAGLGSPNRGSPLHARAVTPKRLRRIYPTRSLCALRLSLLLAYRFSTGRAGDALPLYRPGGPRLRAGAQAIESRPCEIHESRSNFVWISLTTSRNKKQSEKLHSHSPANTFNSTEKLELSASSLLWIPRLESVNGNVRAHLRMRPRRPSKSRPCEIHESRPSFVWISLTTSRNKKLSEKLSHSPAYTFNSAEKLELSASSLLWIPRNKGQARCCYRRHGGLHHLHRRCRCARSLHLPRWQILACLALHRRAGCFRQFTPHCGRNNMVAKLGAELLQFKGDFLDLAEEEAA